MQLVPVQVITASEATINIEETLFYFNGYEDRDMDITLAQPNEVAVGGEIRGRRIVSISDTLETFRPRPAKLRVSRTQTRGINRTAAVRIIGSYLNVHVVDAIFCENNDTAILVAPVSSGTRLTLRSNNFFGRCPESPIQRKWLSDVMFRDEHRMCCAEPSCVVPMAVHSTQAVGSGRAGQTSEGSFSAVSTPTFASWNSYLLESS